MINEIYVCYLEKLAAVYRFSLGKITVSENDIGAPKMLNNFRGINLLFFPKILRQQFLLFSLAPHIVIAIPT